MSAPGWLQLYLEQAVLLAAGGLLFRAAWAWSVRQAGGTSTRRWREAALAVMAAAVLLPMATRLVPREASPALRRSTGPNAPADVVAAPRSGGSVSRLGLPAYRLQFSSSQQTVAGGVLATLAAGVAGSLARTWRRRLSLHALLSALPVVRGHGRVTIAACDRAPVPYAARAGGRAWVVVPTDLIDDAPGLRMLIAHELQHHRQRDLQVLAGVDLLRAAFFWHPGLRLWTRLLDELQELTCDAALVGRGRVKARVYGELLLRTAQIGDRRRFVPRGVTAASGGSGRVLKRRIAMLMTRSDHTRGVAGLAAGVVCLILLAAGAIAARSAVLEKKLETRDVAVLSEKLGARGLVVPVNDVLLAEVNRWLAAPKERTFLKDSRRRLEERRAMVEAALARHQVPSALAAVAIVESGFRNLEQKSGFRAAGVWQLIPDTARNLGLEVEGDQDERMDVEKETDAAARLLATLHARLGDWPLALAGYNEGGNKVTAAIDEGKTRDAWELMRTGRLGRYAATVMAAALVLEDERLFEEAAN